MLRVTANRAFVQQGEATPSALDAQLREIAVQHQLPYLGSWSSSDGGYGRAVSDHRCAIIVFDLDADTSGAADGHTAALASARQAIAGSVPAHAFMIAFGAALATHPRLRLDAFAVGFNMLASQPCSVAAAVAKVVRTHALPATATLPTFACPACGIDKLSEDQLHAHFPLFHSTQPNAAADCPICQPCAGTGAAGSSGGCCDGERGGFAVHLHNRHGPACEREPPPPAFAAFAWLVCRRASDGKFLLVNEPAGICASGTPAFWLPAGRVDAGEGVVAAAEREAMEEAGVAVDASSCWGTNTAASPLRASCSSGDRAQRQRQRWWQWQRQRQRRGRGPSVMGQRLHLRLRNRLQCRQAGFRR